MERLPQPATPTRERPSNQMSNNHQRQQRTAADPTDDSSQVGQAAPPWQSHRELASGQEAAGSNPATPTGKRQVTSRLVT